MEYRTHINIQNLNVYYSHHQALKDISVDIPDKKITAIIGPSGCGKTTLLKSLNRLLDPLDGVKVTGKVIVDGENIYSQKAEVTSIRKKMGLLSQKPQVLPMSIYDIPCRDALNSCRHIFFMYFLCVPKESTKEKASPETVLRRVQFGYPAELDASKEINIKK